MYRERCRRDACAPGGAWKARDPARVSAPRASSPRPPRPDEFSVDSPRPDEFSGEVSRAASFCYRAAVLRGGTAVAVPPLRLPSYSLRSYPFHFFFFKRREKKEDPVCVLPLLFSLSSLLPGVSPQSFPVALELRRVGVGPSPANCGRRRRGGAPGPLAAPELRRRLSSLFRSAEGIPHPDEESDRAREPAQSCTSHQRFTPCRRGLAAKFVEARG